jgi:hypothetical protein
MILDKPRPKFPYPAPRLWGARQRMTLIGTIDCGDSVVILADRQETISDYAKWDCSKIAHYELQDSHRVLFAGAGDSDLIEMVKDRFIEKWQKFAATDSASLKKIALESVAEVTKEAVNPYPRDARPGAEILWAIQQISRHEPITTFRTHGFHNNRIRRYYFTGNPILLSRYLSDMYLERQIVTKGAAEAIAAYILWECKEYDPTVGKHSDIVTLGIDGTLRRMTREEEAYWEEHFYELKKAMQIVPILSCSDAVLKNVYDKEDRMARLMVTLDVLIAEQEKVRKGLRKNSDLGTLVHETVKRDYQRRDRRKLRSKQLDAQTSTDQQ